VRRLPLIERGLRRRGRDSKIGQSIDRARRTVR
jgi:hypothetical protein